MRRAGGQLLELGQQDFWFAVGAAQQVDAGAGLRLEVPAFETVGKAQRAERPDEDVGADGQLIAATGIDLGCLKRGEQPRLDQGIDPNRVERRQIAGQAAHLGGLALHLARGRQTQPGEKFDQRFGRTIVHGSCPGCGAARFPTTRPSPVPAPTRRGERGGRRGRAPAGLLSKWGERGKTG